MTEDLEPTVAPVINIEGQIKSVFYNKTFNLGNYENEKIGIVVEIKEGQTYDQVLAAAVAAVHKDHQEHDDIKAKIREASYRLGDYLSRERELERKIDLLESQKAELEAAISSLQEANPAAAQALAESESIPDDEEEDFEDDDFEYEDDEEEDE